MSLDPERSTKLAEDLDAFAGEVVDQWPKTASQLRTTAASLRILAEVLSPALDPQHLIPAAHVKRVADGLRNWATVYQEQSPQHFVLMEAAERVENLLRNNQ